MFNELEEDIVNNIESKYKQSKNKCQYIIVFCLKILLFFILLAGSLILTVITYPNLFLKVLFLCVYLIGFLSIGVMYFYVRVKEIRAGKKSKEFYYKHSILFWVGAIALYLGFLGYTFSVYCIFNFDAPQFWKSMLYIFGGLLIVGIVVEFIKLEKTHTDNEKIGPILFSMLACIAFIISGISVYQEKKTNAMIIIGIASIALLLISLYWVFKILLSINAFKERTNIVAYSTVFFLIIGVSGGIFLRYIITDQTLQEILTTIFAAVIGGAITLGGVAWTIKDTAKNRQIDLDKKEKDRVEEEKNKNMPYLFKNGNTANPLRIIIENGSYGLGVQLISEAIFIFQGAFLDDKFIKTITLVPPKSFLSFTLNTDCYNSIYLVGSDILGNYYKYKLELYKNGTTKFVGSIGMPIELTKEEKKRVENTNE